MKAVRFPVMGLTHVTLRNLQYWRERRASVAHLARAREALRNYRATGDEVFKCIAIIELGAARAARRRSWAYVKTTVVIW